MSPQSSGWVNQAISALNGMFGDYLQRRGNELAISMDFYRDGQPLPLTAPALRRVYPHASARIVVLLHGLACDESIWCWPIGTPGEADATSASAQDYGRLLQHELGFTPFYLRSNSGLPIAQNGADFSRLLQRLVDHYPCEVSEIVMIGHSMGGLVLRAAARHAGSAGLGWAVRVSHMFYLGTPHSGADVEKAVHAGTRVLARVPNPVTRLIGDVLDLRSQGVKDLRHGAPAAAADHAGSDWLPTARHHVLSGTLTNDPAHPLASLLGDALVRVPAHLPVGAAGAPGQFRQRVFGGVHHLALAHCAAVGADLVACCGHPPG